jgi:hypothetical protein
MAKIFLAHAVEDKPRVREIYSALQRRGLDPWLDEIDLVPGQNWQLEIQKAIRESGVFVACLSRLSVSKQGYVQREFRIALNVYAEKPPGSIYLIPLKIDDCEVPELQLPQLGINLRDIQWLDYWRTDGFERLVKAIGLATKSTSTLASDEPPETGTPAGAYLDPETGLMWTKNDNGKPIGSWQSARKFAAKLSLGGYSNWHLPTIGQLQQLYDPKINNIRTPFSLTGPRVWSSTMEKGDQTRVSKPGVSELAEAWYFNFFNGMPALPDYLMGASGQYPHVLCVRHPRGSLEKKIRALVAQRSAEIAPEAINAAVPLVDQDIPLEDPLEQIELLLVIERELGTRIDHTDIDFDRLSIDALVGLVAKKLGAR